MAGTVARTRETTMLHEYYLKLTDREREMVDQMASDCFACAREDYDVMLADSYQAERAIDGLSRWVIESRNGEASTQGDAVSDALRRIVAVMGPKVPACCQGCEWEWAEALRIANEALSHPGSAAQTT